MGDDKPIDRKAEVHFLIDNFDLSPNRAAEVIAGDGEAAEQLGIDVAVEDRAKDPLAGVPVPGSDKDPEHVEEGAEDLEKPVAHRDSAPT